MTEKFIFKDAKKGDFNRQMEFRKGSIHIAVRLRPFTHVPGSICLLPGSFWKMQLFPTRFCFTHLPSGKTFLWDKLAAPLKDFTVIQDLETGCVRVHGVAAEGLVRYVISKEAGGIRIDGSRSHFIEAPEHTCAAPIERLSLGVHKAQDFELIRRRRNLAEIAPIWHRLGLWLPEHEAVDSHEGTYALVRRCQSLLEARDREQIGASLLDLFDAGFSSAFMPRVHDDQFQGIAPEAGSSSLLPFSLLSAGSQLIRSMIVDKTVDGWKVLPCLPVSFHSGRFISEDVSIEWSKKLVSKVILHPKSSIRCRFIFQKPIQRFRVRRSAREMGRIVSRDEELECSFGETLFLDRFQK